MLSQSLSNYYSNVLNGVVQLLYTAMQLLNMLEVHVEYDIAIRGWTGLQVYDHFLFTAMSGRYVKVPWVRTPYECTHQ